MDFITLFIGIQILIIFLLYLFLTRHYNYWESRGVVCRKSMFFFGNVKDRVFLKKSFHEFTEDFYNEMKDKQFAGLYEGAVRLLYIFDPEIIKQVLVKYFEHFTDRPSFKFKSKGYLEKSLALLEGAEWKKTRVACAPAFSLGRLKAMVPLIDECGQHMHLYLNELLEGQDEVEMDTKKLMVNYTLDVIASTCFGLNLNIFSDFNSEFAKQAQQFQKISIFKRIIMLICILCEVPQWIIKHLPLTFFNGDSIGFITKMIIETRDYRIKNNLRRNDLLQLLLDAQVAPVEAIGETDEDVSNEKREVIDETTSLAQSVFFFVAGFETSSTNLSMICYELAKNKDVQEKARQNIIENWEEGPLTYENIAEMTYLDMIISETLRLYPPVARIERIVTEPIKLCGLNLEKGITVAIPIIGLHHDAKYYPDPMSFKPERFSQEEKGKRHQYVYVPFGGGPRICIGFRLSILTSKICLSYLLKHFEINICEKTPIPFEYDRQTFFLKAKNGIHIKLSKIN